MTASPAIGADGAAFFQNMATSNLEGEYHQLLVAPNGLKRKLLELIDGEIEKLRRGQDAAIFIKVNSVTDRELIDKLAQASQAGVPVTLNVRGICCLRPGVPGLTDNIRVFSIVGRFLEHPRIYAFGVGEGTRVYIGSADLMTRNTERRVEIACPVLDPAIRAQILRAIGIYQADNVKARVLHPDGSYSRVERQEGAPAVDAQAAFMGQALERPPGRRPGARCPGTPPGPVLPAVWPAREVKRKAAPRQGRSGYGRTAWPGGGHAVPFGGTKVNPRLCRGKKIAYSEEESRKVKNSLIR